METIKCPVCGFPARKIFREGNRIRCICGRPDCKTVFDIEI